MSKSVLVCRCMVRCARLCLISLLRPNESAYGTIAITPV